MIKLNLKIVPSSKEVVISLKEFPGPVTIGVKSYANEDLDNIRTEFKNVLTNIDLEKAQANLLKLEKIGDKTDDSYYAERQALQAIIEQETEKQIDVLTDFYKRQILYIKNASLNNELDNGTTELISIKDTREVKPVESLWEDEDECLAALLDVYFKYPPFRDSFMKKISQMLFNFSLDDKIKN